MPSAGRRSGSPLDAPVVAEVEVPPTLTHSPSAAPKLAETLSPSSLGGAHALPGEGDAADVAMARGSILHDLLETLPTVPAERWAEVAARIAPDAPDLVAEALAVLTVHPDLFAPGTLAEVAVTGALAGQRVNGRIDRIVPRADGSILLVDFKSNRVIPRDANAVPEAVLRQLGAYHAVLAQQFAPARLDLAVLWTAEARLMEVPHDLVTAALARASLDHGGVAP